MKDAIAIRDVKFMLVLVANDILVEFVSLNCQMQPSKMNCGKNESEIKFNIKYTILPSKSI